MEIEERGEAVCQEVSLDRLVNPSVFRRRGLRPFRAEQINIDRASAPKYRIRKYSMFVGNSARVRNSDSRE